MTIATCQQDEYDEKGIAIHARVTVPPGWNAEMDREYYLENFDADELGSIWVGLRHWRWVLGEVLDRTIRHLQTDNPEEAKNSIESMSLAGKINLVRVLMGRLPDRGNQDAIGKTLNYASEALVLADQILTRRALAPKEVWMREVVDLRDVVCSAGWWLADYIGGEYQEWNGLDGLAFWSSDSIDYAAGLGESLAERPSLSTYPLAPHQIPLVNRGIAMLAAEGR